MKKLTSDSFSVVVHLSDDVSVRGEDDRTKTKVCEYPGIVLEYPLVVIQVNDEVCRLLEVIAKNEEEVSTETGSP